MLVILLNLSVNMQRCAPMVLFVLLVARPHLPVLWRSVLVQGGAQYVERTGTAQMLQ